MLSKNQRIQVTIDNLGSSGEGVGSYNGFRLFVDGALPGEKVDAKITVSKKTYAKGVIKRILNPSPNRVKAPCVYYDRCGGCQLMHVDYQTQLKLKRQRVLDAFERIGGFKEIEVNHTLPSPNEFSYRNKIQLPVQNGVHIGLYERGSHNLVDIKRCLIHCDLGESVFHHIRKILKGDENLRHVLIKSAVKEKQVLVVLVTSDAPSASLKSFAMRLYRECSAVKGVVHNFNPNDNNIILGKEYQTLIGDSAIHETICGKTFKVSPASFFQVNARQAENLYQYVIDQAGMSGDEIVVDAYCGVGTLSCLLAEKAKKVIGIECVAEAVKDAKYNAQMNHLSNIDFYCKPVEQALESLSKGSKVILNPPRKGCEPEVLEALLKSRPKKIIYISCDPATCARDFKRLNAYQIDSIQPFDMFPQTAHVETVVCSSLSD